MYLNLISSDCLNLTPSLNAAGRRLALCILLPLFLLSGCAGVMSHREGKNLVAEGKYDEGFAKLKEAVDAEPLNAEYRLTLNTSRASYTTQLLTAADTALRQGNLGEAEKGYKQVLRYDPDNSIALTGQEIIVTQRRHRQIVTEAEGLFKQNDSAASLEALDKLRTVLSENPNNKEALNLKSRINDSLALEQKTNVKLAATFKKPISLEFRDASLRAVFDVIAKFSGLNFFFDKDIRPDLKTSVLAKNTTVEDAIHLLLVTNQLEQKVLNENTILIYPNTQQKLQDYQALSVRAFLLTNADVKAVSNTIKTIVKTKDMVIDERLGLIIIRDTPEAIRLAERVIALQDLSDPEVMLEVEVLEVQRSKLLELGIQWPSQLALTPIAPAGGTTVTLDNLRGLGSSTLQATLGSTLINARKQDTQGNILTNPRIRVRNKEKAKILIGDRVPVITTTSTSTGFVSESVSYVDVGLKLEVEPNIYLDDEVAIKISLEVSNIVKEVLSKSGTLTYQIGTRNASTLLRLKDGETQILAGLISNDERSTANKVPLFGEIPILGRLFGSQKDDNARSEILLSITPRIVRSIRRPDLLMAEFESGTSSNVGAQPLRLSNARSPAARKEGVAVGVKPAVTEATASVPSAPVASLPPVVGAVPVEAPSIVNNKITLAWQAPAQIQSGEQFSAVIKLSSDSPLRGMPLLVAYDPQALQVVNVQEGQFFKQAGGQSTFNHRIDAAQGKVFIAAVSQPSGGVDVGMNGSSNLAMLTFKAIKPGAATKLQILSATPDPATSNPIVMPIEQKIQISP
jgi:general secretion pathway protein D